ncbi:alanine racemase [Borreliella carolinensis]|uniref:Alanine racemase n=1 Tax=Borreliella carolinensis TaxID=478174 RepID=A0ABY9E9M5_9SPIR|nr:alanine racemase [Borreliella carolinensis]WKC91204.1 alanine racemase [Borreliella carolinensis]WNY68139.1 alanine racemase [Borreliella carolinensis]
MYNNKTMSSNKTIIINLNNLEHNLNLIKNKIGDKEIVATLKGDAYGHGLTNIFKFLKSKKINYFGLSNIEDAKTLKKIDKNIKILMYIKVDKKEIKNLIKLELVPFVADFEYLFLIEKECALQKNKIKVHLKIDIGMNRYGIKIDGALEIATYIQNSKFLELEGVCSHLPSTEDFKTTQKQIEQFLFFLEILNQKNINPKFVHISNSGHIIDYKLSSQFNMIRPGLILYGYCPSQKNKKPTLNFKPVLSLFSKVIFIKNVKKGEKISYSGTFQAKEDIKIGIIPIGYFDGIPQNISNDFYFLINNKKCKIRGKVCMNLTIVEIPKDLKVKTGSKVEIVSEKLSIDEMSKFSKRSNYELLCNIGKYEKKKYLD